MPLRFAKPSPPSGWLGDFHPQAVEHAGHTTKPLTRHLAVGLPVKRLFEGLRLLKRNLWNRSNEMAELSLLRRRMIEDMTIRNLSPATQ
jgi:hypothetical protein